MNSFLLPVFICVSWMALSVFATANSWSYNVTSQDGPKNWKGICKSGTEQSPINIKISDTKYEKMTDFILTNYENQPSETNFTAVNNGNIGTIVFKFKPKIYSVRGGGLDGVFTTVQFHFHWGSDKTKGSEHTLDGKAYAAELHFVSYNTRYSGFDVAKNKSDGLAVLGVFIEVGGETNQAFSFLTEYATKLANSSSSWSNIRPFGLAPMLPWTTLQKYFRYHGSLTIPGCQESVTWTLFKESVKISSEQMKSLRNLTNASGKQLVNNYRPVQPLNKRTVKNSFLPPSCPVIRSTSIIIDINAGLFSLMLLSALFGH
ncbi:carbonic anhydrase 2-like [Stylophora pistillata]|uniref:Carbonic anhydrase n=1 Tax=Stylophora pistillata TaxID=50429 RepID=A0A1B0YD38_STYPI|nr:carbonic anhydrase 2-like [Stylophora pistillata]ANJ59765.1 alpha carbonic anhydrase 5 [Stylophora pistillata]